MAPFRATAVAIAFAAVAVASVASESSAITNNYTGRQAPGFGAFLFGGDAYGPGEPIFYDRPIRRPLPPRGRPYGYDEPPPPPFYDDGY